MCLIKNEVGGSVVWVVDLLSKMLLTLGCSASSFVLVPTKDLGMGETLFLDVNVGQLK